MTTPIQLRTNGEGWLFKFPLLHRNDSIGQMIDDDVERICYS